MGVFKSDKLEYRFLTTFWQRILKLRVQLAQDGRGGSLNFAHRVHVRSLALYQSTTYVLMSDSTRQRQISLWVDELRVEGVAVIEIRLGTQVGKSSFGCPEISQTRLRLQVSKFAHARRCVLL